jgi:hypothetical protein
MNVTASFNSTITSKLVWMSRQLRNIDDLNALVNWVNTMHSIKALLFPLPAAPLCPETTNHKTSGFPNSHSSLTSFKSQTGIQPSADTGHLPPHRPKLINCKPNLQRSTSFQLSWMPSSSSSRLQHSILPNLSISPSSPTNIKMKNTTRLKPTTHFTTPTLYSRHLKVTVVPSAPLENAPEKRVHEHYPTATETAKLKHEHNLKSLRKMKSKAPWCILCGKQDVKICTRCEKAWYCSPECQSKDWPKHREFCIASRIEKG